MPGKSIMVGLIYIMGFPHTHYGRYAHLSKVDLLFASDCQIARMEQAIDASMY